MRKKIRIYEIIDNVMSYSKKEAHKELPYDKVKEAVSIYCEKHPKPLFRTHVGDDNVARQIASELSGVKIW